MKEQNRPRPPLSSKLSEPWVSDLVRERRPGPSMGDLCGEHDGAERNYGMATRAVLAGQYNDPVTGAVGTPIFQSSTFLLSPDVYAAIDEGRAREHLIYARYGNPSQWSVQQKIAALEEGESAIVFSSGMAAIATAMMSLLDPGAHVITSRDIYGGSYNFLHENLVQYGMTVSFVDGTDLNAIENAICDKTKLLFFESVSNPLLKLAPIPDIVKLAQRYQLRTMIDNTFASPVHLQPLRYGVDVVVHSASKYLNGHSDLIAGVAVGSRKLMDACWAEMLKFGGSLDPHACFLLERGLKTLSLRMERHHENARDLAAMLSKHSAVARVYHPSLETYSQHRLAQELLAGNLGMVGFELRGGDAAALSLLERLRIPRIATSLGGVESLVSLPFNTSHAALMPVQRQQLGIGDGFVRYSVGIEDIEDLCADLEHALDSLVTAPSKGTSR